MPFPRGRAIRYEEHMLHFEKFRRMLGMPCRVPRPTSQQEESPFFRRLPAEIRELIYTAVIEHGQSPIKLDYRRRVESRKSEERGDFATCPPEQESWGSDAKKEWYRWYWKHFEENPVDVPYLNGLSQTCRRAYEESNHLFFQMNAFVLPDVLELETFVSHFRPVQLRQIRELSIDRFETLDLDECRLHRYCVTIPCPKNLKLLRDFDNLRILGLRNGFIDFGDSRDNELRRDLIQRLLLASYPLPSLQTIVITSIATFRDINQHMRFTMDFDDMPGWVYSCNDPHSLTAWDEPEMKEIIQKVHGPFWPRKRQSRADAENTDEYLEAVRLLYD